MVSEADRPEEKLERVVAGLEHISLQHEMTEPRRRRALAELIEAAEAALKALTMAERRHRKEERRLLDRIARMEEVEAEGTDDPFQPSPKILAESSFLRHELSGLGDVHDPKAALMEERAGEVPSGLESLATAVTALTLDEEEEED
jgi:hypothetical protein